MSYQNCLIFILIIIGLILFILANKKIYGRGKFPVGTIVNGNPYLVPLELNEEDMTVIKSSDNFSDVRTSKGVVLEKIPNNFLMTDTSEVCKNPEESINFIKNKEGSCWLDTVLFVFIISDPNFTMLQAAMAQKGSMGGLNESDYQFYSFMEKYIETLRNYDIEKLETGPSQGFVKSLRRLSGCNKAVTKVIEEHFTGDIEKGFSQIHFIEFLRDYFTLRIDIYDLAITNTTNIFISHSELIAVYSEHPQILNYIDDFDNYNINTIIFTVNVVKDGNIVGRHITCLVKCHEKWIYYDDNIGIKEVPNNDLTLLFSKEDFSLLGEEITFMTIIYNHKDIYETSVSI